MKKRAISLLLTVLFVLTAAVPALADGETKAPAVTVTKLTEAIYEDAKSFSEGLAAVKLGGKYGYIDETGKQVIDFKYDYAGDFNEGIALAAKLEEDVQSPGTEWESILYVYHFYLLKEDGTETALYFHDPYTGTLFPVTYTVYYDYYGMSVPSDYDSMFFQDGAIIVTDEIYATYAFNGDGQQIVPSTDQLKQHLGETTYLEVNCSGWPCVDGIISMWLNAGYEDGTDITEYFYMDTSGNIVKTFEDLGGKYADNRLTNLSSPRDGLALATWQEYIGEDYDGPLYTYGTGMLDGNKKWAVQPNYWGYRYFLSGEFFRDGLWTVYTENNKYGAVDRTGAEKIPLTYDFLTTFSGGLSGAKLDGKCFYIDSYNNKYAIGLPGGGIATDVTLCSHFSQHVAAVYDAATGKAYCILDTPLVSDDPAYAGVLPAVEGSENIALDVYFPEYDGGNLSEVGVINGVGDTVAYRKDGKYGFFKLNFDIEENVNPFDDIMPGDWYFYPVMWSEKNGISEPASETHYDTESSSPRSDIVLSIWRACDSPAPTITENPFKDIDETDECYEAALWAYENGITKGVDEENFGPDQTVTRNQIATFLYRAAEEPDVSGMENPFVDVPNDPGDPNYWCHDAVIWAADQKITNGTTATTFEPATVCNRSQLITFLYRQFSGEWEAE